MKPLALQLSRLGRVAGLTVLLAACHDDGAPVAAPPPAVAFSEQAACKSIVPASIGGPMPIGDTVVIRWLGTSNFEVAYHGKIILMDTYYDRPARTRSVGFTVDQVRKADAILIGHAHSDHISDVGPIAAQTGAPVYGSQITGTEAKVLGVPDAQIKVVRGDNTEQIKIGDITIQPTHIVHSTIQAGLIPALSALYTADGLGPLTPAEAAQSAAVGARGSSDPNLVALGTTGFTLTLASGFNIVWFDSVGVISPEETALATQLKNNADVGIFPWTPHSIAETQLAYTFQHLQLFKPNLYLPTHHDHIWNVWLDNGLEPLFMKIRDELPATQYLSPLYRSAICIQTSGAERGQSAITY
ncbi:MAG: MBL fold metallo-hydrolase [Burkholderiaceae bacterium]